MSQKLITYKIFSTNVLISFYYSFQDQMCWWGFWVVTAISRRLACCKALSHPVTPTSCVYIELQYNVSANQTISHLLVWIFHNLLICWDSQCESPGLTTWWWFQDDERSHDQPSHSLHSASNTMEAYCGLSHSKVYKQYSRRHVNS